MNRYEHAMRLAKALNGLPMQICVSNVNFNLKIAPDKRQVSYENTNVILVTFTCPTLAEAAEDMLAKFYIPHRAKVEAAFNERIARANKEKAKKGKPGRPKKAERV